MTRAFHAWAGVIPRPVCQPSVELSESNIRCAALADSIHALELHRSTQPALISTASPCSCLTSDTVATRVLVLGSENQLVAEVSP